MDYFLYIRMLRAKIDEFNLALAEVEKNDKDNIVDRALLTGRINGLLLAWEMASNMEIKKL